MVGRYRWVYRKSESVERVWRGTYPKYGRQAFGIQSQGSLMTLKFSSSLGDHGDLQVGR